MRLSQLESDGLFDIINADSKPLGYVSVSMILRFPAFE
jgi:hypothetical protein